MQTLAWICVCIICIIVTFLFTERYTVWKVFKLLDAIDHDEKDVKDGETDA